MERRSVGNLLLFQARSSTLREPRRSFLANHANGIRFVSPSLGSLSLATFGSPCLVVHGRYGQKKSNRVLGTRPECPYVKLMVGHVEQTMTTPLGVRRGSDAGRLAVTSSAGFEAARKVADSDGAFALMVADASNQGQPKVARY